MQKGLRCNFDAVSDKQMLNGEMTQNGKEASVARSDVITKRIHCTHHVDTTQVTPPFLYSNSENPLESADDVYYVFTAIRMSATLFFTSWRTLLRQVTAVERTQSRIRRTT